MKSSKESCNKSEQLLQECFNKIPGLTLWKRSITTSSIYCKTPDGYSLRIGDHKGKEKYSYKWNLNPTIKCSGYWRKEYNRIDNRNYWRYYTGNVDDLAIRIEKNKVYKKEIANEV